MTNVSRSALAALLLGLGLSVASPRGFAQDRQYVGTWVLDAAKSKAPLMPSSATVVISDAGGGKFKSVSDTAVGGQSVHSEVIFATDGKDYAITTNPAPPPGTSITQSFEKAGATSYKTSVKVAGQVLATTVSEISADGKTMTLLTAAGASASMSTTLVFNRK